MSNENSLADYSFSSTASDFDPFDIASIITNPVAMMDYDNASMTPLLVAEEVSDETISEINAVPTVEASKHNPNSLVSLCVAKILTMKMVEHQNLTQALIDLDGVPVQNIDELEGKFSMLLNPIFEQDFNDVSDCCQLVGGFDYWLLPNLWRELYLLKTYGVILALVAYNTPSSVLLARNYFSNVVGPKQATLSSYFGFELTLENLPNIATTLGRTIYYHCHDIALLFNRQLASYEPKDTVLHKHLRAFMMKYLMNYFSVANQVVV
jgi:hypothetical protein